MNPELDKQLFDKFGKYFPQYENEFNFEVYDGWYYIIYYFLSGITEPARISEKFLANTEQLFNSESHIQSFNKETKQFEARLYTAADVAIAKKNYDDALAAIPCLDQIKEKYGTLRIYVSNTNPRVDALVNYAEGMSEHTCQQCGNIGKRRGANWLRVLCNHHAELFGYIEPLDR